MAANSARPNHARIRSTKIEYSSRNIRGSQIRASWRPIQQDVSDGLTNRISRSRTTMPPHLRKRPTNSCMRRTRWLSPRSCAAWRAHSRRRLQTDLREQSGDGARPAGRPHRRPRRLLGQALSRPTRPDTRTRSPRAHDSPGTSAHSTTRPRAIVTRTYHRCSTRVP